VKEEERRLRVFENMVLRKIFGPKWDEVKEDWQIQHNEELNYSSDQIKNEVGGGM